ncbi:hypothetical protein PMSD_01855 [Paenibacillus macquariensis subsp. defensor]|nr:hypothetical protein PMSD_01855 [Paenibacillus macquariensis subsp. defensor]
MRVFNNLREKIENSMNTFPKLHPALVQTWEQEFQSNPDNNHEMTNFRLLRMDENTLSRRTEEYQKVIDIVHSVLEAAERALYNFSIFVFSDIDGAILYISKSEVALAQLHTANIGVGSYLNMKCAGVNAVSVAMKLQDKVLLKGEEHQIEVFKRWTCLCYPIRSAKGIVGYLNISISSQESSSFIFLLMEKLTSAIESRIYATTDHNRDDQLSVELEKLGLTRRETEIGTHWLMNKSALHIALKLGITEGTTRNHIKKIYRKTNVSDKGQYMKKYLKYIQYGER